MLGERKSREHTWAWRTDKKREVHKLDIALSVEFYLVSEGRRKTEVDVVDMCKWDRMNRKAQYLEFYREYIKEELNELIT